MATHKCSPCGKEFKTEAEYLEHACEKAEGAKPDTADFLKKTTMPHYDKVAEAAQKRGTAKAKK
jgi:hypothetical protein